MSRKDFRLIANSLIRTFPGYEDETKHDMWGDIVYRIAQDLEKANENFDGDLFEKYIMDAVNKQ